MFFVIYRYFWDPTLESDLFCHLAQQIIYFFGAKHGGMLSYAAVTIQLNTRAKLNSVTYLLTYTWTIYNDLTVSFNNRWQNQWRH